MFERTSEGERGAETVAERNGAKQQKDRTAPYRRCSKDSSRARAGGTTLMSSCT